MEHVTITNEAMDYILAARTPNAPWTGGKQLTNGAWEVPLSEDVITYIQEATLPGETFSDTIVRMIRKNLGLKSN